MLPVPVGNAAGYLNAPFSEQKLPLSELPELLQSAERVIGGMIPPALTEALASRGIPVTDIMSCPDFIAANAELTAEAALSLVSTRLELSLSDASILIVGWGRIGRFLSKKLRALGSEISVMSKSVDNRAFVRALGMEALCPEDSALSRFDAVVNTAPARVPAHPEALRRDCLVLELASERGFTPEAHENYIAAPGLPGRYAPLSAARLIYRTVKEVVG